MRYAHRIVETSYGEVMVVENDDTTDFFIGDNFDDCIGSVPFPELGMLEYISDTDLISYAESFLN